MADYEKAKLEAKNLLEKYKITTPVVPVFELAQNLGYTITFFKSEKLNEVAGFTNLVSKTIYINEDDLSYRQSFTVAHELGHIVLQHQPDKIGVLFRNTHIPTTDEEKEANVFAANLLMPKEFVFKVMKEYGLNKENINILASIFGVSPQAMGHHLKYV